TGPVDQPADDGGEDRDRAEVQPVDGRPPLLEPRTHAIPPFRCTIPNERTPETSYVQGQWRRERTASRQRGAMGGRRGVSGGSAQLAAAPDDDGAGGCRRADGGETLGQSDGGALGRRQRLRQGRTGALELLAEGGGVLAQRCDLPFELQDAADALQP